MPTTTFLPTPPITGGARIDYQIPTPLPGGAVITLNQEKGLLGWISSLDGRAHFSEPNIHVGFFNGHVYHGALQFNLSDVPPGAPITYAALELVGLGDQNLADGGTWQIHMLDPAIDKFWSVLTYDRLHPAEVQISILPGLTSASLSPDRVNFFPFGPEQVAALQRHLANGLVSFRIDGPDSGFDNLFTWDSRKARLWLVTGQPEYVVVTSTATPQNVFTAVALAATATAEAAKPTATPLPPEWATPIVVTVPPPPASEAEATLRAELATAEAFLYGTATPTPLNVWTATPTLPPFYVVVTSTPEPKNIVTEAARATYATYVAQTIGTYTPVPNNWVTPVVATITPTPYLTPMDDFQKALATAEAFLRGGGGPRGVAYWTATPTPILVPAEPIPTFTPGPPAGYEPIPEILVGKIAFVSDRAGREEQTGQKPTVYVMDPDGSNIQKLTNRAAYETALARDSWSVDQRYRAYVTDFVRFDGARVPAIYFYDYYYNTTELVTRFGTGIAYDPVWSPTREQIAFVSNESGDDEIWVINRDGSGALQLTSSNEAYNAREIGKNTFVPEMNKRPSWSPDGSQIIFWSNRSGNFQIWIMNADGSNQHIINPNPANDWDPVWIKYTDLPPVLP
jgi:hypothetical protein